MIQMLSNKATQSTVWQISTSAKTFKKKVFLTHLCPSEVRSPRSRRALCLWRCRCRGCLRRASGGTRGTWALGGSGRRGLGAQGGKTNIKQGGGDAWVRWSSFEIWCKSWESIKWGTRDDWWSMECGEYQTERNKCGVKLAYVKYVLGSVKLRAS